MRICIYVYIYIHMYTLGEVETAPDLPSTGTAIIKVFEHMKKHLIRSSYPLGRAVHLLEAVSRHVSDHLHELLRKKNLMDMRYEDFQRLCGYSVNARGQAQGLRRVGGRMSAGADGEILFATCKDVFDAWNEKEREFMNDTSKLRKFHKDAPAVCIYV